MIIGNFRYEAEADTYTGEIRTLHIQRSGVVLRPLRKASEREPDYRVVQHADGGAIELGAAWRRRSDKGQDYLSVLLDDPTLSQPLSVALFPGDDDRMAALIWTRTARKAPEAQPRQEPQAAPKPKRRGSVRALVGPA